jgi:hypothetical protein
LALGMHLDLAGGALNQLVHLLLIWALNVWRLECLTETVYWLCIRFVEHARKIRFFEDLIYCDCRSTPTRQVLGNLSLQTLCLMLRCRWRLSCAYFIVKIDNYRVWVSLFYLRSCNRLFDDLLGRLNYRGLHCLITNLPLLLLLLLLLLLRR